MPITHLRLIHSEARRETNVIELADARSSEQEHDDRPLRCVSSGYLSGGCSCPATVPAGVARAAWASTLAQAERPGSGFFNFAWQGATWLAFGLADGRIRGVYCPTHRAQRDARSAGCEPQDSAQPAREAVPA